MKKFTFNETEFNTLCDAIIISHDVIMHNIECIPVVILEASEILSKRIPKPKKKTKKRKSK